MNKSMLHTIGAVGVSETSREPSDSSGRFGNPSIRTTPSGELTFALLRDLTRLQLAWSFEGTMSSEAIVRRVAAVYGAEAEVTILADSAVLTVDGRTWRRLAIPDPVDLASVLAVDDKTATVTASGGRRFETTDGGASWRPLPQEFPAAPF